MLLRVELGALYANAVQMQVRVTFVDLRPALSPSTPGRVTTRVSQSGNGPATSHNRLPETTIQILNYREGYQIMLFRISPCVICATRGTYEQQNIRLQNRKNYRYDVDNKVHAFRYKASPKENSNLRVADWTEGGRAQDRSMYARSSVKNCHCTTTCVNSFQYPSPSNRDR